MQAIRKHVHAPHLSMPPGLLIVYLSVFIDAFGGLMASPVLPSLTLEYLRADGVSEEDLKTQGPLYLGLMSAMYQVSANHTNRTHANCTSPPGVQHGRDAADRQAV